MNLEINRLTRKIEKNSLLKEFIDELNEARDKINENINLTPQEDLEFYKKRIEFLQNYFEKELLNLDKGEIFLVTNKYKNDIEYHRYKIAQYKNNKEWKYIVFEKDLPKNTKIGDVVRKKDGKYIYDEQATQYIENIGNKIKQKIIAKRN